MTTKTRKPTQREIRKMLRDRMWEIAAMPETIDLFERAHREPHIERLEVRGEGISVAFHGLHVAHVGQLLDALDAIRAEAVARKASVKS